MSNLPVAIIGAGPIGLAAAAHLADKRERFALLEAGASVGVEVLAWAHVQVYSPWRYNVDPVSRALLEASGWKEPDPDVLPTGAEIVAEYLRPLAALPRIASHLRLGARVVGVARAGLDKIKTAGRDAAPFELRVRSSAGEETLLARAVIDASGTYGAPNPLGANGLPAIGEVECRERMTYGIPAPARRRGAAPPRVRLLRGGHEELRPRADVPDAHGLRAGALGGRGADRRSGDGAPGGADAAPDGRVLGDTGHRRRGGHLLRDHGRSRRMLRDSGRGGDGRCVLHPDAYAGHRTGSATLGLVPLSEV